jgi:uncharacterized protein (TIGR03086 family)
VRAMESARRFVSQVKPDQWHVPTPCSEWDMRVLVNHITYENMWAAELFQGKTIAEVGNKYERDLLGDDPIAAYNRSVEVARPAALASGAMERMTHLSFGDYPGSEYASQLFLDLLIHGWDVAKAAGVDARLDPELVQAAMPYGERVAKDNGSTGVFDPVVKVGPDADPQTRLLAMVGRRADWKP